MKPNRIKRRSVFPSHFYNTVYVCIIQYHNSKGIDTVDDREYIRIKPSNKPRLQSLQRQINVYKKQIEDYDKRIANCNQQIMGESDLDRIGNLNAKIQNYFNLIEEANKRIIEIQQSINQFKS